MKKTLLLALSLLILIPDLSAESLFKRKKRPRKAAVEQVTTEAPPATDASVETPLPSPQQELTAEELARREELHHTLTPQQIDSLVAEWRKVQALESFTRFFEEYISDERVVTHDETPDSVYIRRLRNLVSPIHLSYNSTVRNYIGRYVNPSYGTMERILTLSKHYFPMIEEQLLNAGLPVELRALPIIESALSTTAVSRAGAVGLWQFMPSTGKSYGLEINTFIDERRDPVRATEAACRFLKDLYRMFGDWTLAIAAYNCGPGNVNKALARAGGGTNFWDVYEHLPRETRGYVPAFIGASYAYAYHQQHGIESGEPPMPLATDTVQVARLMHLGQVAEVLEVPIETLRTLNPQYKLDIIPATNKSYVLTLPQEYVSEYITHESEIMAKDSAYLKEYIDPTVVERKKVEPTVIYYTVRKGDTLGAIARKYHTTTANLMRWNKIKNANKVRAGQRLRIEKK